MSKSPRISAYFFSLFGSRTPLFFFTLLLAACAGLSRGAEIEWVSQIGGQCSGLALDGHYAFFGEGSGLVAYDVGVTTHPLRLDKLALPSGVVDIAVASGKACLAGQDGVLRVIDTSKPTDLRLLGQLALPGKATCVAIAGQTAYVGDEAGGLHIVDIRNPAAPKQIGACTAQGHAYDLAVSGRWIYMANGEGRLQVIDALNPAAPTLAGNVPPIYDKFNRQTNTDARSVIVANGLAYVADMGYGLMIFDLAQPAAPKLKGSYPMPGTTCVALSGNLVCTLKYWPDTLELGIFNATDPAAPIQLARFSQSILGWSNTSPLSLTLAGDKVFMLHVDEGLLIVNAAKPDAPILEGVSGALASGTDIAVAQGEVYAADVIRGLQIIDAGQLDRPTFAGHSLTESWGLCVARQGNTVLLGSGSSYRGLTLYDVSNPQAPVQRALWNGPDSEVTVEDMVVQDKWAFMIASEWSYDFGVIEALDVSNPANPILHDDFDGPYADQLEISGNRACVTYSYYVNDGDGEYPPSYHSGFTIYDITDPLHWRNIGGFEDDFYEPRAAICGSRVCITHGGGFRVYEIGKSVMLIGEYKGGSCGHVALTDRLVYVEQSGGLAIFNLDRPSAPILEASIKAPVGQFVLDGDLIYALGDGLTFLRYPGRSAERDAAGIEWTIYD